MKKRLLLRSMCFCYLSFWALLGNAAEAGQVVGHIQLSGKALAVVRGGDGFQVSEVAKVPRVVIENEVALGNDDLQIIEACRLKLDCPRLGLQGVRSAPSSQLGDRGEAALYVREVAPAVFVIHGTSNLKNVRFVNQNGKVFATAGADAKTFDAKAGTVYVASCEVGENRCRISSHKLDGSDLSAVATLSFRVEDLHYSGGKLLILARTSRNKSGALAAIFAASGHPSSLNDWYLLELDGETRKIVEYPLLKDTPDGTASFLGKWVRQNP